MISQHLEKVGPHEWRAWDIKSILDENDRVKVVELYDYGRALILDGLLQSVEADQHIMHEMSTHPILTIPTLSGKIFIMGGGEAAMAQECLKYPKIKKVVNADITPEVVEACRKYMPSINSKAYEDPRFKMEVGDAWKVLPTDIWDFIICNVQICGNTEDNSYFLIEDDQIAEIKKNLKRNGWFVITSYTTFYDDQRKVVTDMLTTLSKYFSNIYLAHAMVPSYGCEAIFFYCSDSLIPFRTVKRIEPPEGLKTYSNHFLLSSMVFSPHLVIPEFKKEFGEDVE